MKAQEKLAELREYAEQLQHKLEAIPAKPSQKEDWIPSNLDNLVMEMRKATKEIIESASSPVKIAIVGEFGSGKTSLIGSLLGYADALPISENPTTGNVTAIHLVQQEGLQTTEVGNCTVEYLDEQGIKACLKFMLQEAEKRAIAAQILPQKLSSPPPLQFDRLTKILQWCETAWNSTHNLELRYLVRELVGFIRIIKAYGVLCNRTYPIDNATAKEGLKLADTSDSIQSIEFNQLPNSPHRLSNPPQQLNSSLLQKSFPLIRRVKIEFKISKDIWDLSALKGVKEFILLDFPGLGAANSGVRDTFLSLQELAEVQTILILLDGRRPGSNGANQIFTIMQQHKGENIKDRILVGIGRFDQLPIINEGGEQIIDGLIANDSKDPFDDSQITEVTLLEKLTVLKTTIAYAKAFTLREDRIVLLSPILALSELSTRFAQIQVGSQKFIDNLHDRSDLQQLNRLRSKWIKVSQKIQEFQPKSTLAKQLGDFGSDGGVGRIRELILTHVSEHGLKQLSQDTQKKIQALRHQQEQLKQILANIEIPISDSPSLQILCQSLENLIETYRVFQRDLGKKPLQDRRGISIEQIVKDEVVFKLYNWSEWNSMFDKVKQGMIPTSPKDLGIIQDIFDEEPEINSVFPQKSEDFYLTFNETLKQLEKFSYSQLKQVVENLLNQWSEQVAQERKNIREILQTQVISQSSILERFGKSEAELLKRLLRSDHPREQWLQPILTKAGIVDDSLFILQPEMIFPLARADEKHKIGYIFPWSTDCYSSSINHQVVISRMRQEITQCTSLHIVGLVNQATQKVNAQIKAILDFLIPNLQQLSTQEELLRYMAGGKEQEQATPIWLQILSEIAEISPPD
ncbi:dynamin family protein [Aerosakkonema funiforme]|uniref:dynamin family protein n=1 Tax=Aerosakkonema funiforme TaxID=1246630 RepID=UPI0035B7F907